jgi:hypothetical protein
VARDDGTRAFNLSGKENIDGPVKAYPGDVAANSVSLERQLHHDSISLRPLVDLLPEGLVCHIGRSISLLSDRLWQRSFGGAANVIGTVVNIGGLNVEVIGVMARGFWFPRRRSTSGRPKRSARDGRTLTLTALALAGCSVPASRAAWVDPLIALRRAFRRSLLPLPPKISTT